MVNKNNSIPYVLGNCHVYMCFNIQKLFTITYKFNFGYNFNECNLLYNQINKEVDTAYQGQGIAKKLVENVIQNAKILNKKLEATCSYAKKLKVVDREEND